ncbi:MAG: hypothetical protein LBD88_01540, partial [Candidatus Peribacteria bacterium]|nr:hypothetical protein [Candidatus Peribacteria bacterium]
QVITQVDESIVNIQPVGLLTISHLAQDKTFEALRVGKIVGIPQPLSFIVWSLYDAKVGAEGNFFAIKLFKVFS